MSSSEKFCLRWNDFETNISSAFRELREEKDFFDVTLACDDSQLQAHKLILSACSPFFRNVLRRNPHQHPLLYLKGVKYNELLAVLNFMYLGEVNVAQEELNSFLSVAEDLRVKGLTQGNTEKSSSNYDDKSKQMVNRVRSDFHPPEIITTPSQSKRPQRSNQQQPHPLHTGSKPEAAQSSYSSTPDEEIQELIPVKSEPRECPISISSAPQAQTQYVDHQSEGTIALDESYAEENYDYGQYEESYDTNMEMAMPSIGADGSKDLETLIATKMSKNFEGDWQCNDCLKTSKVKTNIFEHIEATHVDSPGYQCELCDKFCRTRNALRNHKNFKHKQIKNMF